MQRLLEGGFLPRVWSMCVHGNPGPLTAIGAPGSAMETSPEQVPPRPAYSSEQC